MQVLDEATWRRVGRMGLGWWMIAGCGPELREPPFDGFDAAETAGGGGVASSGTSASDPGFPTPPATTRPSMDTSGLDPRGGAPDAGLACADAGTIDDDGRVCFFDAQDPDRLVASVEHALGVYESDEVLYLRLVLDPDFVDNTYGATAIGWEASKRGRHEFKDLEGSDRGRLQLRDRDGAPSLEFDIDYISKDEDSPSGFRSLGVWGGDGEMILGPVDAILGATTSLDRNLNELGHGSFVEDSPATDEAYSPNPEALDWDYRVIYEAWIDVGALDEGALDRACIDSIHASPSKEEHDTIEAVPGPCRPPDEGCFAIDGCVSDAPDDPPSTPCVDDPDVPCEGGQGGPRVP